MAETQDKGVKKASKPKKLLKGGVDPMVGKATQIKKGQVLNPNGKPKGTKHINTWIQELAEDEEFEARLLDLKQGFIEYKGAPIKAIIKATLNDALAANDPKLQWKTIETARSACQIQSVEGSIPMRTTWSRRKPTERPCSPKWNRKAVEASMSRST